MLILFDNGTPAPLRYALCEHVVVEAIERGWDRLANGELSYRQNMKSRKIAFVVVGNQQWPTLSLHVEKVVAAVNAATPGSFVEVEIPLPPKKPFTRT